ncbi:GNAT family N-acetyltransferase [Hamadaea tsunoensis]|uniref:GNAT family N-acetyltransferase n=1 Tax=Hamadaea tsunoensis TaxID=53368 RepID=UPI000415C3BF|nr:GNAT family N-acetyltransferase [Hamadaea tsunoensis]
MQIRTAVEADLDVILTLLADKSINTADPARYQAQLESRHYRPEWTWLAVDGDVIVAAAVWWGFPSGTEPLALDGLYAVPALADVVPVWTELIRAAGVPHAEYHIFLPGGWRTDPDVSAALEPRTAAAKAAGLTNVLERLRYEWKTGTPVPPRSTRLRFETEPSDEAFLDVFRRTAEGSLDDDTRTRVARDGLDEFAAETLDMYKTMPGPREWWKLAYSVETGDLVGFAMPSANNGGPVVGFLGVLPAHRGHRYADDLLAEITADLAESGAARIAADTDLDNVPMVRSFDRLGYDNFGVRLVLS